MTDKQWMTLALLFGPFIIGPLIWFIAVYIEAKLKEKNGA